MAFYHTFFHRDFSAYGGRVITPPISIISAVEGAYFIPELRPLSADEVVIISALIALLLFYFQKGGTEKVSFTFGPIMGLWFGSLFFGLANIVRAPKVIKAVSPLYVLKFFQENGWKAYLVLGEVILCTTGAKAMHADMGHLGALPVKRAWYLVLIALLINYFGQGAFLLLNP